MWETYNFGIFAGIGIVTAQRVLQALRQLP